MSSPLNMAHGPVKGAVAGTGLTGAQFGAKIAAHAAAGGVMGVLQGGKFGHGFASAGFGEALSPVTMRLGGGSPGRTFVIGVVVGGTSSVIAGGKFGNGATTAAFQWAFNHKIPGYKVKSATRVVEKMYSLSGEDFRTFVERVGSRVFFHTNKDRVEYKAGFFERTLADGSQEYAAWVQTQDAALASVAYKGPGGSSGFEPIVTNGSHLTIHAHPPVGAVVTENDIAIFGARIRKGRPVSSDQNRFSTTDMETGAAFLATPTGVKYWDGRSSR